MQSNIKTVARLLTDDEAKRCESCRNRVLAKGKYVCLANRQERRQRKCFK